MHGLFGYKNVHTTYTDEEGDVIGIEVEIASSGAGTEETNNIDVMQRLPSLKSKRKKGNNKSRINLDVVGNLVAMDAILKITDEFRALEDQVSQRIEEKTQEIAKDIVDQALRKHAKLKREKTRIKTKHSRKNIHTNTNTNTNTGKKRKESKSTVDVLKGQLNTSINNYDNYKATSRDTRRYSAPMGKSINAIVRIKSSACVLGDHNLESLLGIKNNVGHATSQLKLDGLANDPDMKSFVILPSIMDIADEDSHDWQSDEENDDSSVHSITVSSVDISASNSLKHTEIVVDDHDDDHVHNNKNDAYAKSMDPKKNDTGANRKSRAKSTQHTHKTYTEKLKSGTDNDHDHARLQPTKSAVVQTFKMRKGVAIPVGEPKTHTQIVQGDYQDHDQLEGEGGRRRSTITSLVLAAANTKLTIGKGEHTRDHETDDNLNKGQEQEETGETVVFDPEKDCNRKMFVYAILVVWMIIYFGEGYMLAFVHSWVEFQLKLDNATAIGAQLIVVFYFGSLIGRVVGTVVFKYLQYWVVSIICQILVFIFSLLLVLLQILWNNDVLSNSTIVIMGLYVIFGSLGGSRGVFFAATFGLVAPVHPITSLVGTGDMVVFAIGFAIGGYGVGSMIDSFGYVLYPYFGLGSCLIQIALLTIMIPYHNKIIKSNN